MHHARRILRAFVVLALMAVTLSVTSPVSMADRAATGGKVSDGFQSAATQTFRNRATSDCLEGTNIAYANPRCDPTAWSQEWNVHRWADGTRRLQSVYSGLCLTDQTDNWGMATCDSSTGQSWFVRSFSGGIELRNQRNGQCLDHSDQYGLRTYPCSATPQAYQLWY